MGSAPFSVSVCLCFQGLTLVRGVAASGSVNTSYSGTNHIFWFLWVPPRSV